MNAQLPLLGKYLWCIFGGYFVLSSMPVFAEESLESVLMRLKSTDAIAITYQEQRRMGFFSEDHLSTGVFYSLSPNTLIKVQQIPKVEFMGIHDQQLYYYQPQTSQRYQTEMNSLPQRLSLHGLIGLMNGDLSALKKNFHLEFTYLKGQWSIRLTARDLHHEEDEQPLKVLMRGQTLQPPHFLSIIETDGDQSDYLLAFKDKGEKVAKKIKQHLKRLQGSL